MKRVSYSDDEPTILVDNIPITDEEAAEMYYSRDELSAMMLHCKAIIMGEVKEDCKRGLELVNSPGEKSRRKQIIGSILLEQWRQRMRGNVSEEALALKAMTATAEANKQALARGKQDAKAAREGVWERLKTGSILSPRRSSKESVLKNSEAVRSILRSSFQLSL